MNNDINQSKKSEDSPPLLGSWNKLYGIVAFSLVVLIFVFYLFTKAFE